MIGPLIRVDGVAPSGSSPAASTLGVTGALVNFGGTGGNQIVVSNPNPSNASRGGLPVRIDASGAAISITNPIKNPSLGSISVTGALIEATNQGN